MKKAVIFAILLVIITTGCSVKKVEELTDSEKFANEFNVDKDNPFVYISIDDLLHMIDTDKLVIFLADSDYEGSSKAAQFILEEANKLDIRKIYYYNPIKLKEKEEKKYNKLIERLKSVLDSDKNGNPILNIPDIYCISSGKIVNHSNYFSKKEELSEEFLTKKQKSKIIEKYQNILMFEESKDNIVNEIVEDNKQG